MIRYKEHEKLSLCEQLNRGQQTHLAAQMKHEALWHRRGEEAPNCIFKHLSKLSFCDNFAKMYLCLDPYQMFAPCQGVLGHQAKEAGFQLLVQVFGLAIGLWVIS